MACKIPIVTSYLSELREIVENEKDVLMARPGDVNDLISKINRLLNDKTLQRKLTENAYKKSKEFDTENITNQFIELYEGLLNGS